MIPDQNLLVEFFGPAGLIVSALIGVVIYQEREKIALRKLNADLQKERFDDIKTYNAGIDKHRETSERMADDYKLMFDRLESATGKSGSK